jgi:hypothetical protein
MTAGAVRPSARSSSSRERWHESTHCPKRGGAPRVGAPPSAWTLGASARSPRASTSGGTPVATAKGGRMRINSRGMHACTRVSPERAQRRARAHGRPGPWRRSVAAAVMEGAALRGAATGGAALQSRRAAARSSRSSAAAPRAAPRAAALHVACNGCARLTPASQPTAACRASRCRLPACAADAGARQRFLGASRGAGSLTTRVQAASARQAPPPRASRSTSQACLPAAALQMRFAPCPERTRLWAPLPAVFVSGGGSNFKAIHAATEDGRINGRVVVRTPSASARTPDC